MDASLEAIDAPCTPAFIGDDFAGTTIRPHWQVFETASVTFTQDDDLTALIGTAGNLQVGRLRAATAIRRADKVTAELRTPPTVDATRTALVLENSASAPIYRLEVDPVNDLLRMTTLNDGGSTVPFDPVQHRVLGIHQESGSVIYTAGPSRDMMIPIGSANAHVTAALHVVIYVSTSPSGTASQVVWDNVVVTCQ